MSPVQPPREHVVCHFASAPSKERSPCRRSMPHYKISRNSAPTNLPSSHSLFPDRTVSFLASSRSSTTVGTVQQTSIRTTRRSSHKALIAVYETPNRRASKGPVATTAHCNTRPQEQDAMWGRLVAVEGRWASHVCSSGGTGCISDKRDQDRGHTSPPSEPPW